MRGCARSALPSQTTILFQRLAVAGGNVICCRQFLSRIVQSPVRSFSEGQAGSSSVNGACLLERLPVVIPKDPPWETEFQQWQEELEKRNSKPLTKDFEDVDKGSTVGAADFEFGPRVTEADRTGDTKSLERKLDRRVFLMLKSKGGNGRWELPQRPNKDGETMRQTAERALAETVQGEPSWKTHFIGNAPCAHFPSSTGTLFMHKAQLIKGGVALVPGTEYYDHAWLSREEVLETVEDEGLRQLFEKLLPKV